MCSLCPLVEYVSRLMLVDGLVDARLDEIGENRLCRIRSELTPKSWAGRRSTSPGSCADMSAAPQRHRPSSRQINEARGRT
jgi:hypothetical protein